MQKLFKSKLFLGGLCLLLAAGIAFLVLPRFYSAQSKTVNAVTMRQDAAEGTVITEEMLTTSEIGAFGLPDKIILDKKDVVGRVAVDKLYAGELLWKGRVLTQEEYRSRAGAAGESLQAGQRLVTLAFPATASAVAGVLRAGNRVDVYECVQNQETKKYESTKVFTSLYVYDVLNKDLESLNDLDQKKESAVIEEDTDYDFIPAYIVFRCNPTEAETLISLNWAKSFHLALSGSEG